LFFSELVEAAQEELVRRACPGKPIFVPFRYFQEKRFSRIESRENAVVVQIAPREADV
jgi:hypothetical protein